MSDLLNSVIANAPPASSEGEPREDARSRQRVELGAQSHAARVGMKYQARRRPSLEQTQSISLGLGSTMEDVSQVSQFFLGEEDYYFELMPLELDEKGAGAEGGYVPVPPGAPLRAGRTYRVRVSLSRNQYRGTFQSASPAYQLDQLPFKLSEEVFVQLELIEQAPHVREALGSITPAKGSVSFTKSQDFEFTVQKDYRLDFTLRLTFWRSDEERLPYQAATLGLGVAGAEAPPPPFEQAFDLQALTEPPPNTAFLHVSPGGERKLKLFGWIGARADLSLSLDISAFEWANPANCPDEQTYLEELTNSLHDYNIEQAAVVSNWLETAIRRYGEGCSIIIADEASALIPWEMFKLPDGRFVGAHALIVRSPGSQQETGQAAAFGDSQKYEGRLCAYVHALDEDALAQAAEMGRLLPTYHKTPRMLELDLLRQRKPRVGLVYLSYGGILYYGDEQQLIACLSRFEPYENDVQIRFNFVGNRLNPRPLFFANAPYSGRIFKTGQKAYGLARAILRQVAASYIGTLGPVKRDYATRVAELLLEAAASSEGVRPAELLRQLRAEAYERLMDESLPSEEVERAYAEFALPFMYVYYGHPHDLLKVNYATDSSEAEGGEQDV